MFRRIRPMLYFLGSTKFKHNESLVDVGDVMMVFFGFPEEFRGVVAGAHDYMGEEDGDRMGGGEEEEEEEEDTEERRAYREDRGKQCQQINRWMDNFGSGGAGAMDEETY